MIRSENGIINYDGSDTDLMADLACAAKAVHADQTSKGIHPLRSAFRILEYVLIGLLYEGGEG